MKLLEGKVAIVTGAGHGVGRGHALDMAAAGAKVVVNDLGGTTRGEGADVTVAEEVAALIRSRGGEAVANGDDVSSFEGARSMVRQAVDAFGKLDILVLNAGILRDKMIFSMDEADWDAVVKVHLKGHFAPARHACEYWRDESKRTGRPVDAAIVTTSSLVGLVGNVGQANYAAAKGGVAMFTIAVAADMERYGVRVNCIAPSGNTRLLGTIPGRDAKVPEPEEYEGYDPMNPGLVAPLAVWLASDHAKPVTGQVFMSHGPSVIHFRPWTPGRGGPVPGADRKWDPEELGQALQTKLFKTRHPGLWGSMAELTKLEEASKEKP